MSVFKFIYSDGHIEYHDVWPNYLGQRKPPPPVYFHVQKKKRNGVQKAFVFKLRANSQDGYFYIEKVEKK